LPPARTIFSLLCILPELVFEERIRKDEQEMREEIGGVW
jgi:hypothetical protein